jgi:hypothetical protein
MSDQIADETKVNIHDASRNISVATWGLTITSNPMFAWAAIRDCAALGREFPRPIVNYIYYVAETLVQQSIDWKNLKVRTAVRDAVFGCQRKRGGPGSFFTAYLEEWPSIKLRYEEEVANRPEMAAAQTPPSEIADSTGDDQSERRASTILRQRFDQFKQPTSPSFQAG